MEPSESSILSTENWFDDYVNPSVDGWSSDSTLSDSPPRAKECIQDCLDTKEAETYGNILIGLSQHENQSSCNDVTAKLQTINPKIVINDGSLEDNHDNEPSLGVHGSRSSKKHHGIPYLENPIIDHRVDSEGRYSYLVWTTKVEMDMRAQEWIEFYWKGRNLLEKASGIAQSKAICPPKRRRVD